MVERDPLTPFIRVSILIALVVPLAGTVRAADWPNWRGLQYDGISREVGLLKSWPAAGPALVWKRELPGGYSSMAVAGGKLFTQTKEGKEETVLCVDAVSGQPVWEHRYPADYDLHPTLDARFKSGPRSTPAVDGGRVYTLGTTGILLCLEVKTGKPVWSVDLLKLAGRACPEFGYSNSPVISGDLLFVHPGGPGGNSLAALNKRTGEVVWKALDDPIGYSTPILVKDSGVEQLVHFTATGLVAVTPKEGKLLWRYEWKTNFDLNVATPIYADGQVFLSSNYGRGAALVRLKGAAAPEEVYRTQNVQSHFSTCVLYQGHLYGFTLGRLRCVELKTGEVKWEERGLGNGSLLVADGQLFVLSERGDLVLAEASPAAYNERSRWKALEGTCWSAPVLANGKLYLRNEKTLLALDVAGR